MRETINPGGIVDPESLFNLTSISLIANKMLATIVNDGTRKMELNDTIAAQELYLFKLREMMDIKRMEWKTVYDK